MRTNVFVFITLGQDQQQPFAHLHGAPALGAGEQRRLQSLERSPSLLWHRRLVGQASLPAIDAQPSSVAPR